MNRRAVKTTRHLNLLPVFFSALILAFAGISACGKEEEPVEITIVHGWGSNEADHVAMRQIYSDFSAENPDVKVNLLSMPSNDDLIRKVGDRILTGKIPDVIFFGGMSNNRIYQYMVGNGLAVDLIPYMEEDPSFGEHTSPLNVEYWRTGDGQLFTVSDTLLYSGGYWYNEDIFSAAGIQKAPESWEEFLEACRRISEWSAREGLSVTPLAVSPEGWLYFLDHLLATNGGRMGAGLENHTAQMERGELLLALEQMRDIFAFSTAKDDNYSYRDETDLFNEQKAAMYINGVWGAPMISEDIRAAYALLPTDGSFSLSCESAGICYILGNTGSQAREEAGVRFLKYMLSAPVQRRMLQETQQVPANPEISLEEFREEMPRFYQAVETVRTADRKIDTPASFWTSKQETVFMDHILEVLEGEMPGDALAALLEQP